MSFEEKIAEINKLKQVAVALGWEPPYRGGYTQEQLISFIESKVGDIPIPQWVTTPTKKFSMDVEKNVDSYMIIGDTIHFSQKPTPTSESVGHIEIRDKSIEIDSSIKDEIQCEEKEIEPTMPSQHCILPNRKLEIVIVSQYGKTSETWERAYGGKVFIRESKPQNGESELEM